MTSIEDTFTPFPQAFIGYTPLEEGGDNEITLRYTLPCDLSKLLSTVSTQSGSEAKVQKLPF